MRRPLALLSLLGLVAGGCAGDDAAPTQDLGAAATPLPDASVPSEDAADEAAAPPAPLPEATETDGADDAVPDEPPEPTGIEAALLSTHCEPGPVPDWLDVDRDFYVRGCAVLGHVLLAPEPVDPQALVAAGEIVHGMLRERPDLAEVLAYSGTWTTVVGRDMGITEVPEYAHLRDDPDMDWDARSRGFGGQPTTVDWPASPGSVGEEDVLCLEEDRYFYESIMVHEFGHTLWDAAVVVQDPAMMDRLWALYDQALADGTWVDTYAEETVHEYWAEGLQSWFDANDWAEPTNGIHGWIDTNEELREADPGLHALVGEVVGDTTWRWSC